MKITPKTMFYVAAALLLIFMISIAWRLILEQLLPVLGLSSSIANYSNWILLAILIFIPKRYLGLNIPWKMSAETEINAPIEAVWDAIEIRSRTDPFNHNYSEIRAVDGQDDTYAIHQITPPSGGDREMEPLIVKLVACERPSYMASFHANTEDQGAMGFGSSAQEYFLTETENGTHIKTVETVEKTTFWLLVTLLIVNPHKDVLRSLKHFCEGTEDTSWMARQMHGSDPT